MWSGCLDVYVRSGSQGNGGGERSRWSSDPAGQADHRPRPGHVDLVLGDAADPHLTEGWQLTGTRRTWLTLSVILGFVARALISSALNISVVADSEQLSAMVTEVGGRSYVGTALTIQTAIGFTVSAATIWVIPLVEAVITWRWAFAVLAKGPIVGIVRCSCSNARPKLH